MERMAVDDVVRWDCEAPDLATFEKLATHAWLQLPGHFRTMCSDLVIRIEDFAHDEHLAQMDIEDPFELMGLYVGASLNGRSAGDSARDPDMVFLYRRAILDYWAEGGESLLHLVTHVLVHEIGHHFGLSDDDMDAIEAQADV